MLQKRDKRDRSKLGDKNKTPEREELTMELGTEKTRGEGREKTMGEEEKTIGG